MLVILDHVRTREVLDPVEKLADGELFQSLASKLISPNIQNDSCNEGDKATRDFAASLASVYRLSTIKTKIVDR
jgi:hypothetical protein